jgi:hypothetical protein
MIYSRLEGGTIINYEIRYMLLLLTAVVNQKPVQRLKRAVGWETILKVSDFHNIINIIYLGILGMEKDISEDCELQFYQGYKRELLLSESYRKAEEVIMWQLERYKIDALFLTDTSIEELYVKPEMAYIGQIEILVEKKDLPQIHRFMRDMDYEQQEDRVRKGTVYTRVPGVRVVFYDCMPTENKVLRRHFSEPVKKYGHLGNYKYIHILSREDKYLYRVARLVESYITGMLKIREILDFWQFQKTLDETFHFRMTAEIVEKADWQEFVAQAGVLATLWFEDGVRQQYGLALELEEYIISRGQENKHLDKVLLPNEKARLDFYWRDREEEWAVRKREWLFPSREYMFQFFPILGKYPFLLVFCWLIRDFRFLKFVCSGRCRQAGVHIRVKLLDIKEKLKGYLRKNKEEEETENDIYFINEEETEGEQDNEEVENQK